MLQLADLAWLQERARLAVDEYKSGGRLVTIRKIQMDVAEFLAACEDGERIQGLRAFRQELVGHSMSIGIAAQIFGKIDDLIWELHDNEKLALAKWERMIPGGR